MTPFSPIGKVRRSMDTVPYETVRTNLARTMDRVCRTRRPLVLKRRNAPSVVMMSLKDYRALEKTAYLLRSPTNAGRLADAIAEIELGLAVRR